MKTQRTASRTAMRGFISAQASIVLAVIIGSTGLLAYEWHHAHAKKGHHNSMPAHHHHK